MTSAESTVSDRATWHVVEREAWDDTVTSLGGDDAYERWGWNESSTHLECAGTVPTLLLATDTQGRRCALPLLVRPLPSGDGFDATSAYGYGGPVAEPEFDVAALDAALADWACQENVVTTFVRFHPLLDNSRWAPPSMQVVTLGETVSWDVRAGRDLLAQMHSHHRRAVRKADRAGVVVRITQAPSELTAFRDMYDETMRRQDAAAFYFFDDTYWESLCATGGGGELVVVEAMLDDQSIAALLCVAHGTALHYHLGASRDAARSIGASNRCFLAAAEWAQARDMHDFHLGGGVGGGSNSPLFQFKHRYDPLSTPRPFAIGKLVHDAARYRAIAGTDSTEGFFPPWRSLS